MGWWISLLGFTVDKLGTYGPAFFMAGGALIVASFTPWTLCCLRDRKTEKIELSLEDYDDGTDSQHLKEDSCHHEPGLEEITPVSAVRSQQWIVHVNEFTDNHIVKGRWCWCDGFAVHSISKNKNCEFQLIEAEMTSNTISHQS